MSYTVRLHNGIAMQNWEAHRENNEFQGIVGGLGGCGDKRKYLRGVIIA